MAFRVGQKVVCVDASPGDFFSLFGDRLIAGRVYEIEEIYPRFDGETLLVLVGSNLKLDTGRGWRANRFRPVVERKTDISIFQKMLTGKKTGVDA